MKTIGMLGGMSWESTALYYRQINNTVRHIRGGLHSAPLLLHSVDFAHIEQLQKQGDWAKAGQELGQAAYGLQQAGADFILICTNTMHKVADDIQGHITIPILHLAKATASHLQQSNISKVGLLGTAYTMEQDFYKQHLQAVGVDVVIPDAQARKEVNKIIFDELCQGEIKSNSKRVYIDIIKELQDQGAQGVIAGCTEISLLIKQQDISLPLFDTTSIHIQAAVDYALQ